MTVSLKELPRFPAVTRDTEYGSTEADPGRTD